MGETVLGFAQVLRQGQAQKVLGTAINPATISVR